MSPDLMPAEIVRQVADHEKRRTKPDEQRHRKPKLAPTLTRRMAYFSLQTLRYHPRSSTRQVGPHHRSPLNSEASVPFLRLVLGCINAEFRT